MKKRTRRDFGFDTMLRRRSIRMTQIELAKEVGISTGRMSGIENDWTAPTPKERAAIDKALKERGA